MQKRFTKATWAAMKEIFVANENHGSVRQDADGIYWEFVSKSRYSVMAKKQGA